jgi:hypothetical protein
MIKFMLILQICHTVANVCSQPMTNSLQYNSYKECAINGYQESYKIMNGYDEKNIDALRTVVNFYCKEVDDV